MRDRLKARRDRVLDLCDLGELLQDYGYPVVPDRQRMQQFPCDLHGVDIDPSARYYGPNNSTYCWVCQKKRDAISYVMEKEHVTFPEAITFLETRLGLDPLPWQDDEDQEALQDEGVSYTKNVSYEEAHQTLRSFLHDLTRERLDRPKEEPGLDCATLLGFWEALDRIASEVYEKAWTERQGVEALQKLQTRVMEKLKKVEGA